MQGWEHNDCYMPLKLYIAHSAPAPHGRDRQDNFVSHTMKAEEQANLQRIMERKSKSDVTHPLEPLIMSLIKGYVDDHDISEKIKELYRVGVLIGLHIDECVKML